MAISNKTLLTQGEPDRWKGYEQTWIDAAQQIQGLSRSDQQQYIENKRIAEDYTSGINNRTQADYDRAAAANLAYRGQLGIDQDIYNYGDYGRYNMDLTYGDLIGYGLDSEDPARRNQAMGFGENWYDYMASEDDYGGGYRRFSGGGGGGGGGGFQMPPMPTMRSGQSMAELLGVIYDYDKIHGDWTDAAEKKYANLDTEYARTQDQYYDSVANNADILMGAMRRGDRDAVQAGTAEGTKAAQEMSALLGISADASQGASELAHGRSDLISQRETELANITKEAMKYYNDLGINLGQLSASELNAMTQAYAAQVATLGGVYNTDVLADVERERIQSTENIAAGDRFSREEIAKWGNQSNAEIAAANNMTAKEVEEIRGLYNLEITKEQIKNNNVPRYGGGSVSAGSSSYPNKDTELTAYEKLASIHGIYEGALASGDTELAKNALRQIEILVGGGIQLRPHSDIDPEGQNKPGDNLPDKETVRKEIEFRMTEEQREAFREGVRKR